MKGELAARLPDLPRWMETRALLLSEAAVLVGEASVDPLTFVVVDPEGAYGAVVGNPAAEAIVRGAKSVDELLAFPENHAWVGEALAGGWVGEEAILHVRGGEPATAHAGSGPVRLLEPGEVRRIRDLSSELEAELLDAEESAMAIAAAIVDGQAVSFCYAGSVSATYWDVAVDTLEPFRRRRLAISVFEYMADHWAAQGRQPVWDALISNPPSMLLAAKLGFARVDSHWVFSRRTAGDTA